MSSWRHGGLRFFGIKQLISSETGAPAARPESSLFTVGAYLQLTVSPAARKLGVFQTVGKIQKLPKATVLMGMTNVEQQ